MLHHGVLGGCPLCLIWVISGCTLRDSHIFLSMTSCNSIIVLRIWEWYWTSLCWMHSPYFLLFRVTLNWACTVKELHFHDWIILCIAWVGMVVVVWLFKWRVGVLQLKYGLLGWLSTIYFWGISCILNDMPDCNDNMNSL